jgi:Fe2+ transport system protein FeoA
MNFRDIQCSMCGHQFNPDQHLACQACPMQSGCSLVCCPACGYQTVNPDRSKFVRLVNFFFAHNNTASYARAEDVNDSLAEVPPGNKARVIDYAVDFPPDRKAYLQAYGLVPNYWVKVLGHSPVTIIQLDNIELALENDLARGIKVQWESSAGEK